MMGAMLKSGDRIDVSVRGDGPVGTIYASSNELGETTAYAKICKFIFQVMHKGNLM